MALSGIRDMSTLEEPPADRQPVQTYVLEHDWSVLGDAIRRELERGGQVYYLHNRVETIDRVAFRLQTMLGEDAAVGVAHGRMSQDAIDDVMSQMTDGEINILVCTTIIETGIDLPNVNTLIIEDADKTGAGPAPPDPGPGGPVQPPGLRLSHLPPGQGAHRGGRQAAGGHPGVRRVRLRLQDRHAGSGDPGSGQHPGPRAERLFAVRGLRYVFEATGGGRPAGAGPAPAHPDDCAASLSVSASIPDRYVPLPGATDGPLPPDRRRPE